MNMKNVAQLVCVLSMTEQADKDYEFVRKVCVDVFGGECEYIKAMSTVLDNWNKQSEEAVGKLFLELLQEVNVSIKADLEANALKEKENAS